MKNTCIDCKKLLKNKNSKRCQKCHLKRINNPPWNYKGEKYCQDCGKKIFNYYAKRCKACNGKIMSKYRIKDKAPGWKGGRSLLAVIPSYISHSILKRDNYTCQLCNKRGNRLDVHHIIPKSLYSLKDISESNKEFNLITICRKCHNWIHGRPRGVKL